MIRKQLYRDQQGLVSILVTMIFLIVISLIVVGFAQIARREQRQALDRQLSAQAFYAAESGINIAKDVINAPKGSSSYSKFNNSPADKTICDNDDPIFKYELDGSNVKNTCLLIDQAPRTLQWKSINPTKSTIVPIRAYNSDRSVALDFTSLKFEWQNEFNPGDQVRTNLELPEYSVWDSGNYVAPVLRVEIIPSDKSPTTRTVLLNETATVLLTPSASGSNVLVSDISGLNQGGVVAAGCDTTTRKCSATISGLSQHEYYLRIKSVYKTATVTVSADGKSAAGVVEPARIGGAQAEIDSTGKAVDVLKRVRVKMPYNNLNYDYPEGVLESADTVCKRLSVTPSVITSDCTGETPIPDTTVTAGLPPPSPAPGAGDAEFQSCLGTSECTGSGSGTPDYRWKYSFFNTSGNPTEIVKSCRWDWGDGTYHVGSVSRSSDACLDDQFISHTYPTLLNPLRCRIYTAKLTVYFKDSLNYAPSEYFSKKYVPNGTLGSPQCAAQGFTSFSP